jgi:peptidoglycan hydrolase-like protein with peptidoglycan-binding domain
MRARLIVVLLTLVVVLGIGACGGGDDEGGETDAADTGALFPADTGSAEEPPPEEPAGGEAIQIAVPDAGDSIGPQSPADRVLELQKALRALGFKIGKPDGIYGGKTRRAVERFQKNHKLGVDGLVGPKTAKAINKELRERAEAGA